MPEPTSGKPEPDPAEVLKTVLTMAKDHAQSTIYYCQRALELLDRLGKE